MQRATRGALWGRREDADLSRPVGTGRGHGRSVSLRPDRRGVRSVSEVNTSWTFPPPSKARSSRVPSASR